MRILITGAAGFIGFHLSKAFLERGDEVVGYDNFDKYYSVRLKQRRVKILKKYKNFKMYKGDMASESGILDVGGLDLFDVVESDLGGPIDKICHLAAKAGVRHSIDHPSDYIFSNLVGFSNVIECAKNHKVKNFVYASSSSVYGNNKGINKESLKVNKPISLYAATKACNEVIAYYYHDMFGLNCTGLRFHTCYGPWGRPDMALHLFADGIAKDKPINIFNNGDMIRDFTYVDDIVSGIIASLDKNYPFEIFNLGSAKEVKLMKYVKTLEKYMGKKAKKNFMPMQPGDVKRSLADISRAQKMLNYKPKTYIDKGIKEFVEWYKQYYQF